MISDDTLRMIHQFSVDRDWQQFHAPANMAKSVSIEAGELLECFQWSDEPRDGDWEHVYEELADVMIYCIQMADVLGVDLDEIIRDKMAKNAINTRWKQATAPARKRSETIPALRPPFRISAAQKSQIMTPPRPYLRRESSIGAGHLQTACSHYYSQVLLSPRLPAHCQS